MSARVKILVQIVSTVRIHQDPLNVHADLTTSNKTMIAEKVSIVFHLSIQLFFRLSVYQYDSATLKFEILKKKYNYVYTY